MENKKEVKIIVNRIFYLCDRKACGENHDCGECKHTDNIEHAVNFEKQQGRYYKEESIYEAERKNEFVKYVTGEVENGRMTPNQARIMLGLAPNKDGYSDKYLQKVNFVANT